MLVGTTKIRGSKPPTSLKSVDQARIAYLNVLDYRREAAANREHEHSLRTEVHTTATPPKKALVNAIVRRANRAQAFATLASLWEALLLDWFNRQTGFVASDD